MTKIIVQAVPWEHKRAKRAVDFAKTLGAEVVWDQLHYAYDTWCRVVEAIPADEGAILLEDDIILCPDWRTKIEAAIAEKPDQVLSFFSMERRKGPWNRRLGKNFYGMPCYYIPPGMGPDLAAYARSWDRARNNHDLCLADYMEERGLHYYVYYPSLVDHEYWRSSINPTTHQRGPHSPTFEETFS